MGEYWFGSTDGADLMAVGDGMVFVGGPFQAALLDATTGVELEHVNYEETETEQDPEDQYLAMGGWDEPTAVTVGTRTVTVLPSRGEITSGEKVGEFVPAANPMEVDGFVVANALEGLVVSDGSGRTWSFEVEKPMVDEGRVVGSDGWVFAPTSSGEIVAIRLDPSALDAAEVAWRDR